LAGIDFWYELASSYSYTAATRIRERRSVGRGEGALAPVSALAELQPCCGRLDCEPWEGGRIAGAVKLTPSPVQVLVSRAMGGTD
jgi:hypothetical protein